MPDGAEADHVAVAQALDPAAGVVGDPASLWDLDAEKLAEMPQWGERSAANLKAQLDAARKQIAPNQVGKHGQLADSGSPRSLRP